jgi:cytoskeletal protein CcmA (bactofilin family)
MSDLTGKTIAETYRDLLQIAASSTGGGLDSTPRTVQDGSGNNSALQLSNDTVNINGTLELGGTAITKTAEQINSIADISTLTGIAAGDAGTIYGRTLSASVGISISNADGTAGNPTFSLAATSVSAGTYAGQTTSFDVDATGRITGTNTTDTVSVGNVNTVNLSATTVNISGNTSIGGTLTMSGALAVASLSVTGDIHGNNVNVSAIDAASITVSGIVSATSFAGSGAALTSIVAASATNASYAASAGEAAVAVSANHATSANTALFAGSATNATNAVSAVFASSATNATNAVSAVFANSATNATNAINVDYGGVVETSSANLGTVSASDMFISGPVSVGGTVDVSGAVSIGGGLFVVGDVSAGNIYAGGILYGNGAGLFNVPSESGGTVNFVKAGTGIHVTEDGVTTTNPITASGTLALNADQSFGTVSATNLTISASATFEDSATLHFGTDKDLTIQHNGSNSLITESGTGSLFVQSNDIRLTNTGSFSMLTLTDGQDAEFPYGVQVSGTVSATSFVGPTITSIGNRITSVTDYATSITAVVSSTMATSIANVSSTMATSIANHLPLAGGTMTGNLILNGAPSTNLQAATKQYVDNLTAAAIHFHTAVRVESPDTAGNLNATYDNGTSGVGATLTNAGTQSALVIDGVTLNTSDRVLIYNQTNGYENGVYTVTDTGSASTNWVLTRATDADSYEPNDNTGLDGGSYFFVEEGDTGAGEAYVCSNVGEITIGTTDITFVLFSSALVYTAGSGININGSRVISTSGVPTDADLTALSATMATSINNTNTNVTALSATMATSINNSNTNITTNTNAITSINSKIATVSSTLATSISNSNSAITALSATMATSINNTNTNLTALSATFASSISNYMPLSGGTFTGNTTYGDNVQLQFGTSNDLEIYHNGTNSIISDVGTGDLIVYTNGAAFQVDSNTGENMIYAAKDAGVNLYHNNNVRIQSTNAGATITGTLTADSLDINGNADISGTLTGPSQMTITNAGTLRDVTGTYGSIEVDGGATNGYEGYSIGGRVLFMHNNDTNAGLYDDVNNKWIIKHVLNGATDLRYAGDIKLATTSSGVQVTGYVEADSLYLGDGERAYFGVGNDLQIYHDGSNSYIDDAGTGNIRIRGNGGVYLQKYTGENMVNANADGSVDLYYNNAVKLQTTNTGIDLTGDINAVDNIYLGSLIFHEGDTDTYLQFHNNNEWRVVTGGTEMLEVNDSYVLLGANSVGKVNTNTVTGSVAPDFYGNNSFVWTLSGNLTLSNPTTEVAGMSGVFVFIQDATGGRTLSLSSDYETAGAAGITLSTAANAVDIVPYFVQASGNILLGTPQLAFA